MARFGNVWNIIDVWVTELESAAAGQKKGTRSRYQALVTALKLINRATALTPELDLTMLMYVLADPIIVNRVLATSSSVTRNYSDVTCTRSGLTVYQDWFKDPLGSL